jgi:hypothetical protein
MLAARLGSALKYVAMIEGATRLYLFKKNQRNRKSGAALMFVIITFAVIVIFSLIVMQMVSVNLVQSKAQELDLKAYYLSVSGADLCFSALLQQGSNGENDTLLYQNFNPSITAPTPLTDSLTLDGGVANLTVTAITKDGERWIEIQSIAVITGGSRTRKTILDFLYSNPLVQKRS